MFLRGYAAAVGCRVAIHLPRGLKVDIAAMRRERPHLRLDCCRPVTKQPSIGEACVLPGVVCVPLARDPLMPVDGREYNRYGNAQGRLALILRVSVLDAGGMQLHRSSSFRACHTQPQLPATPTIVSVFLRIILQEEQ